MKAVAVVNQKGGVGKTTVVLGLASAAAAAGVRTLIVDLDPQSNASGALLGDLEHPPALSVDDVLGGARGCAPLAITQSSWGVGVIPATLRLASRDLDTTLGAEQKLRRGLDSPQLAEEWDLCLIDCPPSVGRLVSAALVAADEALIVTEPSLLASQGVAMVQDTIATVAEHYNPTLSLAGVAVNRVAATNEARLRVDELGDVLGDAVWRPVMRQRAALVSAVGAGVPIHQHTFHARDEREEVLGVLDTWLTKLMSGVHA